MGDALLVFGAGMAAAFNPCGVAMLPAFVVRLIASRARRVRQGTVAGFAMTLGFIAVFGAAGLIADAFAVEFGAAVPWIALAVGVAFVGTGVWMVAGGRGLLFHLRGPQVRGDGFLALFVYGVAYALGSLGCTLPLFSLLVLSSFARGGALDGLGDFLAYALGMGLIVTAIAVASMMSQQLIRAWLRKASAWMGRISAWLTLATGVYLIVYWLPYVGKI
jgi:cytochrome c biogenesis protein CcdA